MISNSTLELTDEKLVEAYKETHLDEYFAEIYNRYSQKVFAKSMSLFKNQAKAEDATHEIFIKILLNVSKFKGTAKFSTWIYSITYNYCIDLIRKEKKQRYMVSLSEHEHLASDVESKDELADRLLHEIKMSRLEEVLDEIDSMDRSILMMKYMDNMSMKEIGAIINKSESATKMNIMRAKQRFKKKYRSIYNEEV